MILKSLSLSKAEVKYKKTAIKRLGLVGIKLKIAYSDEFSA